MADEIRKLAIDVGISINEATRAFVRTRSIEGAQLALTLAAKTAMHWERLVDLSALIAHPMSAFLGCTHPQSRTLLVQLDPPRKGSYAARWCESCGALCVDGEWNRPVLHVPAERYDGAEDGEPQA